jgi:hypothetical protein
MVCCQLPVPAGDRLQPLAEQQGKENTWRTCEYSHYTDIRFLRWAPGCLCCKVSIYPALSTLKEVNSLNRVHLQNQAGYNWSSNSLYTRIYSAFLILKKKIKVDLWDHLAACVSLCICGCTFPLSTCECLIQFSWNLVRIWWHLNPSQRRTS